MNDFAQCLAYSHSCEDEPCWEEIYAKAFPDMVSMTTHRADGDPQRSGVDRSIVLASSKQLLIDEKARRRKDTGDVLLEYVSNDQSGKPGWVEKPLTADYVAYAFIPSGRAYLFPVPQMQSSWRKNKSAWLYDYGTVRAQNRGYQTLNCPVPIPVLYKAIGQMLRVDFTPLEAAS